MMKLSNDIFGITDHRTDTNTVFLFSEELRPKNTDHTISFLQLSISNVKKSYPWKSCVHIFLDNAGTPTKTAPHGLVY